jgi:hypothetical protein
MIPQEVIDEYNLLEIVEFECCCYAEIRKAMYGRKESGFIANQDLKIVLAPYIWFLALSFVIFCLNHCVGPNLADGTKSPLQVATFLMTDISPLLYFYFWQPVCFLEDESQQSFPGNSKE